MAAEPSAAQIRQGSHSDAQERERVGARFGVRVGQNDGLGDRGKALFLWR